MSARSIRIRPLLTLAVVAGLLFSVIALPQADAQTDARAVERSAIQNPIEVLKLRCAADIVDGDRGVLCRWSASDNDTLRGYQLYRIVNGSPRELVATVGADGRLGAFDTDINAGDRLVYGVVARNRVGRVIGQSRPARVHIPG